VDLQQPPMPEGDHLLGARLRALREARGLSQSELARRSGVRRTYLIALERGQHDPTLATLQRLAQGLGMNAADLVRTLVGEPFTDPTVPLHRRLALRRRAVEPVQRRFAERAGLDPPLLSALESGRNDNPRLSTLRALARGLYCCPSELVRDLPQDPAPRAGGAAPAREAD
jgi:transcriptional regulator with XRE-family HTH domain